MYVEDQLLLSHEQNEILLRENCASDDDIVENESFVSYEARQLVVL